MYIKMKPNAPYLLIHVLLLTKLMMTAMCSNPIKIAIVKTVAICNNYFITDILISKP